MLISVSLLANFYDIQVAQNFLQDLLYFSQNKQTNSKIFLWLIFNVPLATTGPWNNNFSRACAGGHQIFVW
jgi:hypothetical protein